jgi:hypothetical protein
MIRSGRIPLFEWSNNLFDPNKKCHQFRQTYTNANTLPTPTPESPPLATESPTSTSKQHNRENENNASFDDDNGRRIWHRVEGKWKGTLLITPSTCKESIASGRGTTR